MQSIGIWMLLLAVLVLMITEADAAKTKTKTKIKIVYKKTTKRTNRGRRSIDDTLTLPCEISKLDTDKDGSVSRQELEAYIAELNPGLLDSPEYKDYIIEQLDVNGNGVLQIKELYVDTEYKKVCI